MVGSRLALGFAAREKEGFAVAIDGGYQQDRISGGAQLIAEHMADALGDALLLETPAREIEQDRTGVTVWGDGIEVRSLKHLIIERTGGNPFFMEEIVQVLLDEGALVRDGAAVRITRSLSALAAWQRSSAGRDGGGYLPDQSNRWNYQSA